MPILLRRVAVIRSLWLAGLALPIFGGDQSALAVLVTINSTDVNTSIIENSSNAVSNFSGTAIPTSDFRTATFGNGPSSRTDFNFFEQGAQTILDFDFTHTRSGFTSSDYAWSTTSGNAILFTAAENSVYELSGFYNVTDNSPASAFRPGTQLRALLQDVTANQFLVGSLQQSRSTVNEQFVLGGTEGDTSNSFFGSLTGNLIAGHQYRLEFGALTTTTLDLVSVTDAGSSALGNINLTIGPAVPEPRATALLGLMLIGFCGAILLRRKRKDAGLMTATN